MINTKITVEMTEKDYLNYIDFRNEREYIIRNIDIIRTNYIFRLNKYATTNEKKLAEGIFNDIKNLLFERIELKNK